MGNGVPKAKNGAADNTLAREQHPLLQEKVMQSSAPEHPNHQIRWHETERPREDHKRDRMPALIQDPPGQSEDR